MTSQYEWYKLIDPKMEFQHLKTGKEQIELFLLTPKALPQSFHAPNTWEAITAEVGCKPTYSNLFIDYHGSSIHMASHVNLYDRDALLAKIDDFKMFKIYEPIREWIVKKLEALLDPSVNPLINYNIKRGKITGFVMASSDSSVEQIILAHNKDGITDDQFRQIAHTICNETN